MDRGGRNQCESFHAAESMLIVSDSRNEDINEQDMNFRFNDRNVTNKCSGGVVRRTSVLRFIVR